MHARVGDPGPEDASVRLKGSSADNPQRIALPMNPTNEKFQAKLMADKQQNQCKQVSHIDNIPHAQFPRHGPAVQLTLYALYVQSR